MVKVFGKPKCAPCKAAVSLLEREDIPVEYVDLTEDEEAARVLRTNGFLTTPVFSFGGSLRDITGLRDIIAKIKEARAA